MISITCFTRKNCEGCRIVTNIISNSIFEIEDNTTFNIRSSLYCSTEELLNNNINVYPTTIIKKDKIEIHRFEGTFTKKELLDKLKLKQ